MKIGVVSDTHSRKLPRQMVDDFKTVDLICHAGDFCDMADYEALSKIKEVKAVAGNMDSGDLCAILPKRQIVTCGRFHIGLFHGGGPPKTLFERVKAEFKDDPVDVVIFGHSHHPFNEKIEGVLYFNPGSPSDPVFAPYSSYGILDLSDSGITGSIIKLRSDG